MFVMVICAMSVSLTMLVLSLYHRSPSDAPALLSTPVPTWVSLHH